MNELPKTIAQARQMLTEGKVTSVELAQICLDNINAKNSDLNIYLQVFDDVLDQATAADTRIAAGESAPLLGVPISIKDNILYQGHIASSGSQILSNYVASYNAHIVNELLTAGAIIIGRVNMDEFAMGSSCEYSAFGPTKNPLDNTRVPGGSSGGSAASVAANMCVASIGTDTAGSVRLPASFCGLCGLYPTYGSTSRYGLIAMGSSLDQAGPVGNSVSDCETLFTLMSTPDELHDAQSVSAENRNPTDASVKKIGVPRALLSMDGVSETVRSNFNQCLDHLRDAGYDIVDIDLPHITAAVPTYYVIIPAEVSTNLSRMDGVRFGMRVGAENGLWNMYEETKTAGFGPEVQRRMLLGAYVLSAGYYDAYYGKATKVRELIKQEIESVLETVDVILTPTATMGAPKLGAMSDPIAMYMMDIFTVPANLSGLPALSVPFGVDSDAENMPLGVQIMGPRFGEAKLFALGKEIEGLR